MTGSASFAHDADVTSVARERLDLAAAAAAGVQSAERDLVRALLDLWPMSAWRAAGATSAKRWLLAYTHCSEQEAHRLERLAGLCHRHPALAEAVLFGEVSMARAHTLGHAANPDREPWLADSLDAFLRLAERGCDDADWAGAVRHWASLVDQEREVRRVPAHSVVLTQKLFGGGEIHGDLSPNAFLNVATALDAWTDDPDPKDAPYQRSLGERRADALDDICRAGLDPDSTRWGSADAEDDDHDEDEWEDVEAADTFDGFCPTDDLDEHLASTDELDPLVRLRRRLRKAEAHRRRRARRRTRSRSGICVNVHIDLRTLADLRHVDDLEDLVLRGDGWNLTRAAADQLLCDAALTAVLFDGKGTLLDANDAAEQWSRKQRRAIAARDGGCVFPGCGRPPRHCDIHHLHHRGRGGPTRTGNGAMLCRFHHRLLHHHGWRLLVEDGRWIAIDAHGTRWTGRPTPLVSSRGDPP
ncbi:HNH endonuclease [Acidimicrobiia bacterium EGI L10123]|uniref:HNH endonuclease signature motif containing protein n=1 Tax=Salinilacustrithrix flava TaxID=2957203 RepID=UPI003D7C2DE0|nr:HNH endonuclease [Acidimicrobiia bacterium EGI L10123]